MSFRVVSRTGWSFVGKSSIVSRSSLMSSIDGEDACCSSGESGMRDSFGLVLAGLVEVDEALEFVLWP